MDTRTSGTVPAGRAPRRAGVCAWLVAGLVALAGAALQGYRMDDSLRGFHVFNEGFYLLNGLKDASGSLLAPLTSPLDPNNPWVYPLLLSLVLRVFGPTAVAARLLSVVASGAAVLLTFALGKRLYNETVGLLAATVLAFTPAQALIGRNIQTEAVMLALLLLAVYCYLRAVSTERKRWSVATGLLVACGAMTKLPAVLAVPAFALWQTWRARGTNWVGLRSTWLTASAFAAVAVPFYGYRAASSTQFREAQGYLLGTGGWRGLGHLLQQVFSQWFWMLSPCIALAAAAGVCSLVVRRRSADKLVLSLLATYAAFFVFYNAHSYYYYPLAPLAALAVGRGANVLFARGAPRAALAMTLIVILTLPFTLLELSAKKYSPHPPGAFLAPLASAGYSPGEVHLVIDAQVYRQVGRAIELAAWCAGVTSVAQASGHVPPAAPGKRRVLLTADLIRSPGFRLVGVPQTERTYPVAFGYAFLEAPGSYNFFDLSVPELVQVGPA